MVQLEEFDMLNTKVCQDILVGVLGGVKSFWEEKVCLRVRATDMWALQAAVWKGPQAAGWVASSPTRPLVGKLSEQPHKGCGLVSILSSGLMCLSVCSASTPPWEHYPPSAWASCVFISRVLAGHKCKGARKPNNVTDAAIWQRGSLKGRLGRKIQKASS